MATFAPIDYSTQVAQPFEAAAQGYQIGAAIRDDQAKQQQLAAQQAQAAQQQQVLQRLISNPNPSARDYADATLAIPSMREHFDQAWKTLSADQVQASISRNSQLYAAIGKDKGVAKKLADAHVVALRNSGRNEEAQQAETIAGLIETAPELVRSFVGMNLISAPGGDKIFEALKKQSEAETEDATREGKVRKGNAEATTAEATATYALPNARLSTEKLQAERDKAQVDAKYAEKNALMDLEKKGWDIKGIQADVDFKRQSSRIALMNAQIAREGNDLKRQELQLKVDEARQKLADSVRTKAAEAESSAATIDNMLNTIERVRKNPSLGDVLGSMEGRMPAIFSDENADAIALIENLTSQTFMAQIPAMKGTGALSEKEGDKLQASLQNLSRTQSEEQFRANLTEASRLMLKARENLSKKTGVPLQWPDTPATAGAPAPAKTGSGVTVSGW